MKVNVVGAGLVGSLLSIFLARRGFSVELYERRPDMRVEKISAGRSINLAVSTRGLHALKQVGLEKEILKHAIPMRGRMIHSLNGELTFQRYGLDDSQCINSISRAELNKTLLTTAEATKLVRIHFNDKVEGLARFAANEPVIGTDGSASAIRDEVMKQPGSTVTSVELDYGYKELVIPPGRDGSFKLEKNALHIWPRGNFMLIALPNFDGSFTCTLFLPFKGAVSFESLSIASSVRAFFDEYFADAAPLVDQLEENFLANPTGRMVTIKCSPWHLGGRALLLGDAAHAIVPFFGQGMNCGFEDCTIFDEVLSRRPNWADAFAEITALRKTNADAIADLAIENFVEMRDKVADSRFLLEKAVERVLQEKFPASYVSRYSLVTFSRAPYRLAYELGLKTSEVLAELCRDLARPEDLDMTKAEMLVSSKIAPLLRSALKSETTAKRA